MKVNEFIGKGIEEVLRDMDLADVKVHPDSCGNVMSVELKYIPKDVIKSDVSQKKSRNTF